jgi:hypothetical protein
VKGIKAEGGNDYGPSSMLQYQDLKPLSGQNKLNKASLKY